MPKAIDSSGSAKRLLFWRKHIRWKLSADARKCGPECVHVSVGQQKLDALCRTELGVMISTMYRTIHGLGISNGNIKRCCACHKLYRRHRSHGGECRACAARRARARDKAHPEKARARWRAWRNNPEVQKRQREQARARYEKLKSLGLHLLHKQRRRALKRSAIITGESIRRPKRGRCFYCGIIVSGDNLHMDHVVPLYRGGAHAAYNVVVACKHCNLSKGAKHPNEFSRQQVLCL